MFFPAALTIFAALVMKKRYAVALLLLAVLFWLWGVVVEPYILLETRKVDVAIEGAPKGLEEIKIAVVADIHAGATPQEHWRAKRIVSAVNAQKPDIIIFLGDYTNGYFYRAPAPEERLVEYLSAFHAPLGKFGIFGNHDIKYGKAKIEKILRASGVEIICNNNRKISTPRGSFYLAGIDDPQTSDYSFSAAMRGIPAGAPVVFLTHNPSVYREIPQGVGLVLAGHTHGGQVRLPFFGNVMPVANVPRRLVSGVSAEGGRTFHTSAGLGVSRLPIRFFCPPEFTILTIKPKG